jgi:hypothetical protein
MGRYFKQELDGGSRGRGLTHEQRVALDARTGTVDRTPAQLAVLERHERLRKLLTENETTEIKTPAEK